MNGVCVCACAGNKYVRKTNLVSHSDVPQPHPCLWRGPLCLRKLSVTIISQFAGITRQSWLYLTNNSTVDLPRLENLEITWVRKDAKPNYRKEEVTGQMTEPHLIKRRQMRCAYMQKPSCELSASLSLWLRGGNAFSPAPRGFFGDKRSIVVSRRSHNSRKSPNCMCNIFLLTKK